MALPSQDPSPRRARGARQGFVAFTVFAVAIGMLGMSFAAVPLYRAFCAATGFAGTTQVRHVAPTAEGKRIMTVHFDANVGRGLALSFAPEILQVSVRTGQTATVFYKVTNLTDHEIAARAVYNVSPGQTGAYFDKLACFCFTEQHFGPHQTAEMPVVFFLDPALEKDDTMSGIDEVTLSYTFYPAHDGQPLAQATGIAPPRL
ncbi:MAG: cytochrome c oxidase assembly protein [Methylovirgula sp.]|uniref:cytochrome c oxidase assembly protein n=1 Tax=Methylovirgula sp. TaxID=1978224 RepID=UPI0030766B94